MWFLFSCLVTSCKRKFWTMGIAEDFADAWFKTHIHRRRKEQLLITEATELPYIILSPAEMNKNETAVRKGKVTVEQPQIILPGQSRRIADFSKLEEEKFRDIKNSLILGRLIKFPAGRYRHLSYALDINPVSVKVLTEEWFTRLEQENDGVTGLVSTCAQNWQLALLVYIAQTVGRSMYSDIDAVLQKLLGITTSSDSQQYPERGGPRDSEFYL
eukprot:jgi/Galph1/4981/GphlegSOOS_G3654.1